MILILLIYLLSNRQYYQNYNLFIELFDICVSQIKNKYSFFDFQDRNVIYVLISL